MNASSSDLSSVWDHLEELRRLLIKIAWVVLIGTGIAFIFHQEILQFLTKPLTSLETIHSKDLNLSDIKYHRVTNTGKNGLIFVLPEGGSIKYLSPQIKTLENKK